MITQDFESLRSKVLIALGDFYPVLYSTQTGVSPVDKKQYRAEVLQAKQKIIQAWRALDKSLGLEP